MRYINSDLRRNQQQYTWTLRNGLWKEAGHRRATQSAHLVQCGCTNGACDSRLEKSREVRPRTEVLSRDPPGLFPPRAEASPAEASPEAPLQRAGWRQTAQRLPRLGRLPQSARTPTLFFPTKDPSTRERFLAFSRVTFKSPEKSVPRTEVSVTLEVNLR